MNNDPFGAAIADYFEGDKKATIHVNSNITENEKIKVSALFRTYRGMSEMEKKALDVCNGRVLDIGAGSGTHSVVLQRNQFDVTSIDSSPKACEVMQKRGLQKVVLGDIFQFKSEKFDTMLLLMNGIGIAGTLEGLDILLKHLYELLNIGGKIYLESTDILYVYEEADGSVLIDLHGAYYGELQYDITYNTHRAHFPWLYVDYDTLISHAEPYGYACEQIFTNENAQYLACLTKK